MARSVRPLISILFALLLIAGCGTPAPTATLVPSTATAVAVAPTSSPVPPTPSSIPPTSSPLPPTAAPPTVASAPTAVPPTAAPAPTPTQPAIADIVAQLQGLPLDQFFDASYKQLLLRNPEGLTYAGMSEQFGLRNDQLNNLSDAYVRDTQKLEDAILEILRSYDRAALSPEQQVSYDVYEWYLDSRARGHDLVYCEYPIHFMVGSYDVELIRLFTEIHPLVTRQDVEDYISRLSQVDDQVAQVMEGLELREQAGTIPPNFIVEMALSQPAGHCRQQCSVYALLHHLFPKARRRQRGKRCRQAGLPPGRAGRDYPIGHPRLQDPGQPLRDPQDGRHRRRRTVEAAKRRGVLCLPPSSRDLDRSDRRRDPRHRAVRGGPPPGRAAPGLRRPGLPQGRKPGRAAGPRRPGSRLL